MDFDPDSFLANTSPPPIAAPAPVPASSGFDPDAFLASTAGAAPQPSAMQELGQTGTDIPTLAHQQQASALSQMNAGFNPMAQPGMQPGYKPPGLGQALENQWEDIKAAPGRLMAPVQYALSYPTAAVESVLGHPMQAAKDAMRNEAVKLFGADKIAAAERYLGHPVGGDTFADTKGQVDFALGAMAPGRGGIAFEPSAAGAVRGPYEVPPSRPTATWRPQQPTPDIPTVEELHDAASQNYLNARGYGVEIKPKPLADLSDSMLTDLSTDGFRERNVPKTWSAIQELKNPAGANATIDDVDSVRKALRQAGANPLEGAEREASGRAIAAIDNYMASLDPADVAINPHYAGDVADEIAEARGNWGAYKRSQQIQDKLSDADLQAAATGSGANINNAIRQKIKSILINPKLSRGYSQDELDQMERVVRGTYIGNGARLLGKLAPTGIVSGGLGVGLGSLAAGMPGAAAVPVLGSIAKYIGDASTMRQARLLDEMVRSRSPLGQAQAQAPGAGARVPPTAPPPGPTSPGPAPGPPSGGGAGSPIGTAAPALGPVAPTPRALPPAPAQPLERQVLQRSRSGRPMQTAPLPIGNENAVLQAGMAKATAPPLYSAVEQAVAGAKQDRAPASQWLGQLNNTPGVKPEEMQWLGLTDWLKQQKGPVTKQQIADYVRNNNVQLQEIQKEPSDTKFGQYSLPGGENYREMMLSLPERPIWPTQITNDLEYPKYNYRVPYLHSYGDAASDINRIAHVRFNDRTIDGKKTLFLEEVQSDWHQAGRQKGYQGEASNLLQKQKAGTITDAETKRLNNIIGEGTSGGVPDAPFKTTWPELVLKRMIRYAAENGYDQVAWTPGKVQAERYDLSKQIKHIDVNKESDGTFTLDGVSNTGQPVSIGENIPAEKLADTVGKDLAQKITTQQEDQKRYSGVDLTVGGKGMQAFYDKMLPDAANKLVKRFGTKVGKSSVDASDDNQYKVMRDHHETAPFRVERRNSPDVISRHPSADAAWDEVDRLSAKQEPVHTLPITPALRRTAITRGFPQFATGGRVPKPKLPHKAVGYIDKSHVPGKHCSLCEMFRSSPHECTLVRDPVQPGGWCRRFKPKG